MILSEIQKKITLCVCILLLSACSAVSKQHAGHNSEFITFSSESSALDYASNFDNDGNNKRILYLQESGRLYHIAGDYAASRDKFAQVLDIYRDSDYDGLIRLDSVAGKVGSTLTNDKVIPYKGSDYERVYARQFQAMNYLALGDIDSALVEIRAGANDQKFSAEARAKQVEKAEEERREKMIGYADKEQLGFLNELSGDTRNGFLNSYMYYFSALLREATGDANAAYIDYRNAWELNSQNLHLSNQLLRLANRYDRSNEERYQKITGIKEVTDIPSDSGRVVLLVERGFVPPRREFSAEVQIDYFSPSGYKFIWYKLATPTYNKDEVKFYQPISVSAGDVQSVSYPLMSSVALSAHQLKEAMPGIIFRQVTRVIAKQVASDAAIKAGINSDNGGEAALLIAGGFAAKIGGNLLEQADTRTWLSLPAQIDNAELILPAGTHQLNIELGGGRNLPAEATVTAGGVTIIRLFDNGIFARADQLYPLK